MNLFVKLRKNVGKLLLIAMLAQLFGGVIPIYASAQEEIELNLSILNPKDVYYPNETLIIGGGWNLPDDTVNKQFSEGYQFTVVVPDTLSPQFSKITLGDMGSGIVDGNKIVFTFNENIEQLMDRKGGFNLSFKINDPGSNSREDVPIELKDNFGNTLVKDTISVDGSISDTGYTQETSLTKGSYGANYDGYTDGLKWYLRVNEDKSLSENNNTIIVKDQIVGDNHIYDIKSFEVSRQIPDGLNVGKDKVDLKEALKVSPDKKSFELKLDVSDKSWYNVDYKTIYVGDPSEDMKDGNSLIELYNKVEIIEESGASIYPGSSPEEVISKGEFSLSGWAEGKLIQGGLGKAHIKKIDKHTKEPIAGVKFEVTHIWNGGKGPVSGDSKIVTTDSNGIAYLSENDIYGTYQIKEVAAADGYILDNKTHFINIETGEDTEIVLENIKAPRDIYISKEWLDENGNNVNPQESVEFILYADDKPVRKLVFTEDMKDGYFKRLPIYNEDGEKIIYRVQEVSIGEYDTSVKYDDNDITVINQAIPKQIELKEIKVTKNWIDTNKNKIDAQEDIEIILFADSIEVGRKKISTEENTVIFEKLPVLNEDGSEILYTIDEISSEHYEVSIEYLENKISITNKLISPDPEDNEDDKPVDPEDNENDKPVDPEDTEDDKPVDPEDTEDDKPVDPEDTEDDKPIVPEDNEDDKPVVPEDNENNKPIDPEDNEDDKPIVPEDNENDKPIVPEDNENDKPVDPEDTEGDKPVDPEDTEDDKPVDPEDTEGDKPVDPEDTEDDKPVDPEDNEDDKPVDPEDTEDDKPVDPEDNENNKPIVPEDNENDKPIDPEDTEDDKPIVPEDNENDKPVVPEDNENNKPIVPEDNEDDKPIVPEDNEDDKPIVPEDNEDDKPVVPEDNESNKPIDPEDTEDDKPIVPEDNENDKPIVPEDNENNKPIDPEDTEDDKPIVPEDNENDKPIVPEDNENNKPIVPEDNEDDKPIVPEDNEDDKPIVPEDNEIEDEEDNENDKENAEINTPNSSKNDDDKFDSNDNNSNLMANVNNDKSQVMNDKDEEDFLTLPKTGEVNVLNQLLLGLILIIIGYISLKLQKEK